MQQGRNERNGIAVKLYRFSLAFQCFLNWNAHSVMLFFVLNNSENYNNTALWNAVKASIRTVCLSDEVAGIGSLQRIQNSDGVTGIG